MSIKNKVALFYEHPLNEPQKIYIVRDVVGDNLLVSMVDDLLHILEPEGDDCVSYLVPMWRALNDHWLFFDDVYVAHSYAKSRMQNAIARD